MSKIIKYAGILIAGIIFGLCSLFFVYALPVERMQENALESLDPFMQEGENPFLLEGYKGSSLDNFTDAIMLGNAVYEDEFSFWESAMEVPRAAGVDGAPMESLEEYLEGERDVERTEYSRYWHGYLLFLKPLLYFFNYEQIRIINGCVQAVLLLWIACEFFKKRMFRGFVAFVLAVLGMFPVVFPRSLQFSTVFYIGNIALLLCLKNHERWKRRDLYPVFFFITGMCTSFFDFLTYPLYTFGMPIVLYLVFESEADGCKRFFSVIKYGTFWATGYALMWVGKWIVGSLLTGENFYTKAFETVAVRMSSEVYGETPSRIMAVLRNGYIYANKAGVFLAVVLIIWIGSCIWRAHGKIKADRVLMMVFAACMPVVWYLLISNHSYAHYWYTFRALSISIFALAMIPECINRRAPEEKSVTWNIK